MAACSRFRFSIIPSTSFSASCCSGVRPSYTSWIWSASRSSQFGSAPSLIVVLLQARGHRLPYSVVRALPVEQVDVELLGDRARLVAHDLGDHVRRDASGG